MEGIHPISAVLLLAVAVTVAVLAGVAAGRAVAAWRRRRRESRDLEDGPVIDLTHFHQATQRYNERVREEREERVSAPRSREADDDR